MDTHNKIRHSPAAVTTAGAQEQERGVTRRHLVNKLNYLNFQDQTILVGLRHVCYDSAVTLRARPKPCAGERLECGWAESAATRWIWV